MADIGGIGGLLQGVVQRSAATLENAVNDDADENQTTTETEDVTASAGADTTDTSATVGEGLAFQPVAGTGTDQTANDDTTGTAGRVVEDQVSISAQARQALEEAQNGAASRSPAEQIQAEATDPSPNLAFQAADTTPGVTDVGLGAPPANTNQVEAVENDSGAVVGNTDVSNQSVQSRELGQLVDQFA